ncbi:uncharacterized protein LOC117372498 [Periophthalmus magnuspinnatus]|uniref:uncharacterized protein LOC117372498 n=1 Tax=Periophthalmus magnuspinnatus TaxID=409849 RepID=UPI00145B2247|nr:uncharacterized protein LOC117372498 [Periophthalmus magnuspinnatus]
MASCGEDRAALRASLLSCLGALDPSITQTLDDRVLELFLLRTAEMRRRRVRETEARARRLRHYLQRRKAVVLSAVAGVLSIVSSNTREIWSRDRPVEGGDFWQAAQCFTDEDWKAQFRVTRATFTHLLQLLESTIARKKTHIRTPIDARRRLAITLWWYGQGEEYRHIAERFGVGVTTVCIILRQVTMAIVNKLFKKFVLLPSGEKLDAAVRAFKECGYPQCAGAIGATHIPIVGPRENPQDYMNSSGWYSVILQAVVDQDLQFTHVYAGWPGSNSNTTVLSSSDLLLKAEDQLQGALFPQEKSIVLNGVEIPVHLIGDPSFPLKPWLLTGYNLTPDLSPQQRRFTYSLNAARSVVNSAFSRLKGRWSCLQKRKDIEVTAMPGMVSACCVLHNVCEYLGDEFFPEWSVDSEVGPGLAFPQPEVDPCEAEGNGRAEMIRHAMTYNFLEIQQQPTTINGFTFTYED